MRLLLLSLLTFLTLHAARAVDLKHCRIVVSDVDAPLVAKMAGVLSDDICRVTGVRPKVARQTGNGPEVVIATAGHIADLGLSPLHEVQPLQGQWEQYTIQTRKDRLIIVGSDPRGAAYGVLHVSRAIGVNPWYWWADIPVPHKDHLDYKVNYTSRPPSVKYRGFFINDEDWGLKPWASLTYEPELGDIGPRTYDRVCELILRLRGNMLAPAMHTCTGAFYSHPESQRVAAEWGIMITTSHCEPLLFNNAAPTEWDKERDGEWNYQTNRQTILDKLDNRIRETAQYDNIYTMGMRGLHDEAMRGPADPQARARTLEAVFADQRAILEKYKQKPADSLPQIFVPYKETLDIYDAGLHLPDDIILVWPDDNYGYMKRVSDPAERLRSGGSGVYYHLSYLGTPHDYLWLSTTAPMLMYEELLKAYQAGADRYWLLNVGDIKPMELEIQHFFDMAWDFTAFSYDNANCYQAQWLAEVFGKQYRKQFQRVLDIYYRLAWQRKPEYMGYEMEWSGLPDDLLHDTDFSFETGTAQRRLDDYSHCSQLCQTVASRLPADMQPAFFEMLGYSVLSAEQMNRKFLMAQLCHETGSQEAARQSQAANDSLQALLLTYNTLLGGKWNQMMSEIPPGFCAKYQQMPQLSDEPTMRFRLPVGQQHPAFSGQAVELTPVKECVAQCSPRKWRRQQSPFRLVEGIGVDWFSLQLGQPHDPVQDAGSLKSDHADLLFQLPANVADSIRLCITCVPFWPVSTDRSNRFGVSVDGCTPVVCENHIEEWSYPWKLQVLENRKDYELTLPIDPSRRRHTLSLIIGDPGQIIQRITIQQ